MKLVKSNMMLVAVRFLSLLLFSLERRNELSSFFKAQAPLVKIRVPATRFMAGWTIGLLE